MTENKPHLVYTKQPEATTQFRFSNRSYDPEKQGKITPNLWNYVSSLSDIQVQMERRVNERNPDLNVNESIFCLEFEFYGWFNSFDFEEEYRTEFGLTPIRYFDLNTKALFAIVDQDLFNQFLLEINKCVGCRDHSNPDYNKRIRYIKSIRFHNSEKILSNFTSLNETVYLSIIDNLELSQKTETILDQLTQYLQRKNISYLINEESREIEVKQIDQPTLEEIAKNFDVVHSVNSNNLIVTRPVRFGTNIKEYPFKVKDPEENCPLIGIVDTGVSVDTPLEKLVINTDNSYGLEGMNPRVDDAFKGDGHGTAVAGFTALGNQLSGKIQPELIPDCKVLSIKVLGEKSGKISTHDLISLIRKAKAEHGIKIFVLTICFSDCLKKGEAHSDYAYLLDKLAFDLDILIFICTANFNYDDSVITDYPKHYLKDETNFCSPAESINNITIGAIGDNLEPELPITPTLYPLSSSLHPAAYTRKYHLNYDKLRLKNGKLCKPDVVYSGGNVVCIKDNYGTFIEYSSEAGLQYLSATRKEPILRGAGTSYSTALVANIGAKLLKLYPALKPQTIKALIINSSEKKELGDPFHNLKSYHKNYLIGNGKPEIERCLFSNDNEVTIVIEDSIKVGRVKSLPIQMPKYLNAVTKNKTLVGVEATLCFKVLPVKNNQIAYCPVNIAFGFFKNIPLDRSIQVNKRTKRTGISGGSKEDICFNDLSWSQDAYYKSKILSNTQKVSFYLKREEIVDENNTFKLAINCHFHKLLPTYITQSLPDEYEYSLVIRMWENRNPKEISGQLYSQMEALNELQVLPNVLTTKVDVDLETDLEAELD